MSNNIFIRLSYEDVKASLMENVRVINDQNPIVDSMLSADELIGAFTSYVTSHGIHDYGNIQVTLIRDANFKNTHLFISGFGCDNTTKSIKEWRYFLEDALKYHWKYFWADFLKERYDSCLELANYHGESEVPVADAKELLKYLSFTPWIQSLVGGRALRSPSSEDFELLQANDQHDISMNGFFPWLYQTKTVGFKWVESEEKIRRGTFYRRIEKQIHTIRLLMVKVDPTYYDRKFAMFVLEEAMRHLGACQTKDIMAMLKNDSRLNGIYEKISRSSGLSFLKAMADKSWERSRQEEPPVVHAFEPPQFFVHGTQAVGGWFTF